jgi:hypothetical protein
VGLERGPLSLVSTTEELLVRKYSGSSLENRDSGRRDWSRWSGESSWLQVQRSGFDSRLYQIFWQVVGLERGPLSLVSTTEELLVRKYSGSSLENRDYGRRDWSRWSGESSWLHVQRSGFDSWRYQIFWEVVGLERGPFILVSTIEELTEWYV